MHEHDQEIIMALAEGTLGGDAGAVAAAGLADCDVCVRDLELQRIAVRALREATPAYLSATESTRLHTALKEELSMASPTPLRKQPRAAWGRRAGLAFGAAALFLGAVLMLPTVLGGSDDSSDTAAAARADVQDQAAIESATTAAAVTTANALEAPEAAAESVGEDETATYAETIDDLGGAAPTTAASNSPHLPTFTGDATTELRERVLLSINEGTDDFYLADEAAKQRSGAISACATTAQQEVLPAAVDFFVVATIIGDDGIERYLVAYVPADTEATVIAAITLPQCEVFQTVP